MRGFCCGSGPSPVPRHQAAVFEGDVEAGAGGEGDEHFETEFFPFAADWVGDALFVVAS